MMGHMLWAIPSTENFQRQHLAVACVCRKEIPLHFPPCYRIRTSTRNRETTEMTFPLGFPRILLKDMSVRWQERCENLLVWSGMDAPNTLQALCEIPSLWHLIPSDLVRSYYFALSTRLVLSSEFQPDPWPTIGPRRMWFETVRTINRQIFCPSLRGVFICQSG